MLLSHKIPLKNEPIECARVLTKKSMAIGCVTMDACGINIPTENQESLPLSSKKQPRLFLRNGMKQNMNYLLFLKHQLRKFLSSLPLNTHQKTSPTYMIFLPKPLAPKIFFIAQIPILHLTLPLQMSFFSVEIKIQTHRAYLKSAPTISFKNKISLFFNKN